MQQEILEQAAGILGLSVGELKNATKYKQKYIDLLKQEPIGLCEHCQNLIRCEGKECPKYIEGRGGTINGKQADFHWDCRDFDYGTCPFMEGTPCDGCYECGYSGFVLMEDD